MGRFLRYDHATGKVVEYDTHAPENRPPQAPESGYALGFGQHQLADFEADRQKNGFSGVEFVRDRDVPEFFNVKCSSRKEYDRYVKHRGYVNRTGVGGVRLSKEELDRAAEMVSRSTRGRDHA